MPWAASVWADGGSAGAWQIRQIVRTRRWPRTSPSELARSWGGTPSSRTATRPRAALAAVACPTTSRLEASWAATTAVP